MQQTTRGWCCPESQDRTIESSQYLLCIQQHLSPQQLSWLVQVSPSSCPGLEAGDRLWSGCFLHICPQGLRILLCSYRTPTVALLPTRPIPTEQYGQPGWTVTVPRQRHLFWRCLACVGDTGLGQRGAGDPEQAGSEAAPGALRRKPKPERLEREIPTNTGLWARDCPDKSRLQHRVLLPRQPVPCSLDLGQTSEPPQPSLSPPHPSSSLAVLRAHIRD